MEIVDENHYINIADKDSLYLLNESFKQINDEVLITNIIEDEYKYTFEYEYFNPYGVESNYILKFVTFSYKCDIINYTTVNRWKIKECLENENLNEFNLNEFKDKIDKRYGVNDFLLININENLTKYNLFSTHKYVYDIKYSKHCIEVCKMITNFIESKINKKFITKLNKYKKEQKDKKIKEYKENLKGKEKIYLDLLKYCKSEK